MQPKMQPVDERIIHILEAGPATPDEVARGLSMAWATAQGHLLKLVGAGKVSAIRKGRVNVYILNSPRPSPKMPKWAKSRPLEELARELAGYFPQISAAEMIELERRQS
jgi:DNA-binding transcriptional ArsR family regulator